MLTITSEHPSFKYNFERIFQDKISPYNQSFENSREELTLLKIYYRDKIHSVFDKRLSEMKSMNEHIADILAKINESSSGLIQNYVLTINSDHPSS